MALDLLEPLSALPLEQGDGDVFLTVLERRAIAHQAIAGIDKFGQVGLLGTSGRPYRRLQGCGHAGQQHGVDAIGLGERPGGLGEASGTFRVELDAGPIGQRGLQRAVISGGRLVGDPFDLPLPQPGNQRILALGRIRELPFDSCGVNMTVQLRFGDVDADGLW